MPLAAGTRLGPYEVGSLIGKGGMGEVYRARDTKLDRDVAIKVLPEEFAKDKERLARFEREAKLLASLNHPNIASIYGIEESDGVMALILELVEGPTLAERIAEGPISVEETLAMAKQIAEALEAGHEAGVIHRDVKPANVKLKDDGTVKVLDYGLAKALEGETATVADSQLSQSPTLTRHGTQVGVILGTTAYMSPEQAKGKRVDKRTDVWSFGVVLYEMLMGRRLFTGETVSDVLAAVLTQEPDFEALPPSTPEHVRGLLHRCLVRDPKRRLRDIGEVRLVFEDDLIPAIPTTSATQWGRTLGAFVAGGALFGLAVWMTVRPEPFEPSPSVRFSVAPTGQGAVASAHDSQTFALSRDGSRVFYVDVSGRLVARSLGEWTARTLTAHTNRPRYPFVSPDGAWVGFFDGFGLKKVSSDGGTPVVIARFAARGRGASWGPDDTIVFSRTGPRGLMRVSASGGEPEVLTTPEPGEGSHAWPEFLPGGRAVLFAIWNGSDPAQTSRIDLLDLETGRHRTLLPRGTSPRYSSTGHVLYVGPGGLEAVPFDLERLELTGEPVVLTADVSAKRMGASNFAVSSKTLIYVPGDEATNGSMKWKRRDGSESEILEGAFYGHPRLSPDGGRVAVSMLSEGGVDVWIRDLERGTGIRLTVSGINLLPVWARDGRHIAYSSNAQADQYLLYRQAADGGSPPEPMFEHQESSLQVVTDWSRDDGSALIVSTAAETGRDVYMLPLDGTPLPFVVSAFSERAARFSPDGRWVAYVSDQSGRDEIHVRPFSGPAETISISNDGGTEPAWSPNGTELFYRDREGRMMSVAVKPTGDLAPERPRVLFDNAVFDRDPIGRGYANYDVSPDGESFLMVQTYRSREAPRIHVVLNWAEELKRPLPIP